MTRPDPFFISLNRLSVCQSSATIQIIYSKPGCTAPEQGGSITIVYNHPCSVDDDDTGWLPTPGGSGSTTTTGGGTQPPTPLPPCNGGWDRITITEDGQKFQGPCTPGTPIPPGPASPNPDPCDKTTVLKTTSFIPPKFIELRNEAMAGTTHESGYVFTSSAALPKVVGPPFGPGVDPEVKFELTDLMGFIHSHPCNYTLPIFSSGDLFLMYQIISGRNQNTGGYPYAAVNTFTFGVTTCDGSSYFLTVQDIDAFITFGEKNFAESKTDEFDKTFKGYIKDITPAAEAPKKMLELIRKKDIGISLIKANNDFTQFFELKLVNGIVVPFPCT